MAGGRRRKREFIDWFGLAYAVATALTIVALIIATTLNGDP